MPQLSPLNWLFLFLLFWACIFSIFSMLWWSNKMEFSGESNSKPGAKEVKESHWSW